VRFESFSFGFICIDCITDEYDVIIDRRAGSQPPRLIPREPVTLQDKGGPQA